MPSLQTELLILRHAEAGHGPAGGADSERPLTPAGLADATRQGQWIHAQALHPDAVLASTARRAAQTTEQVLDALGDQAPTVTWDSSLYLAPVGRLLTILRLIEGCPSRVLLVGHNPGLHALVEHLSGKPLAMGSWGRAFPPASLARLTLPRGWQDLDQGCGELTGLQAVREGHES